MGTGISYKISLKNGTGNHQQKLAWNCNLDLMEAEKWDLG